MKKILPLFFIAMLTSCGTPSIEQLTKDKEKLSEYIPKCFENLYTRYRHEQLYTFEERQEKLKLEECKNTKKALITLTDKVEKSKICRGIEQDKFLCELFSIREGIEWREYASELIIRMNYLVKNRKELKSTYNNCRTMFYKKAGLNPNENHRVGFDKINGYAAYEQSVSRFPYEKYAYAVQEIVNVFGEEKEINCRSAFLAAEKLDVNYASYFKKPL